MSILVRRCLSRSYLVEELVENWQLDHQEALLAGDVEELVSECLELSNLLKRAWRNLIKQLLDEQVDDLDKAGRMMLAAVRKSEKVLQVVQGQIAEATRRGHPIETSGELQKAIGETHQLAAEIAAKWPATDHQMIAESLAAYKRGDYQFAGDLLNALPGCGSEANQ